MAHCDTSETCTTIGEYIVGIVLKELFAVQIRRLGADVESFDPLPVRLLLQRIAPALADDVLAIARGWVPAAAEVSPESLLPDLDQFPAAPQGAEEGLSVQQRRLLLGALEIVLDVFNDPGLQGGGVLAPLLPRPSVACIAAQLAAVLEHLTLLRPRGTAAPLLQGAELDLAAWQRVCAAGREPPQRGSKEELVEELQQCRQHIFQLERELDKQGKLSEASGRRATRDQERTTSRLLAVNQALEGKLKQQTQEVRTCREQLSDTERRVQHERWRVEQKAKRAAQLEVDLARFIRATNKASV